MRQELGKYEIYVTRETSEERLVCFDYWSFLFEEPSIHPVSQPARCMFGEWYMVNGALKGTDKTAYQRCVLGSARNGKKISGACEKPQTQTDSQPDLYG